ncbi:hypothetical protein LCGC14_0383020 [marine sediment metagenome]|uniref:Uncharacterized protein n=1 Tax=marine sediment metagenome TaxID=412755 RepID=A0A0F9WAI2_9ZZZZ
MPVQEIERLSKDSKKAQIGAAISACISAEVRGGMPQDQAMAACHEQARQKGAPVPQPRGGS